MYLPIYLDGAFNTFWTAAVDFKILHNYIVSRCIGRNTELLSNLRFEYLEVLVTFM